MVVRVAISAGGTGGHIFPALAVASALRNDGHHVLWMGATGGMEERIANDNDFPIELLDISGVRGKGILRKILTPMMLIKTIIKAFLVIRHYKADLVLGMGGYVSAPVGIASWINGVPLYIHEQNSIPGLTNRLLSKIARHVLTAFPNTFPHNENVTQTGNPVRDEIIRANYEIQRIGEREGPIRVLVLGGSLGAAALNALLPRVLSRVNEKVSITVLHQCGKGKAQDASKLYDSMVIESEVVEFIDSMDEAYNWADFVICRAGALTIAELCSVGLGALFIPFPYAVDDHQTKNAEALEASNAAIIESESDMDIEETAEKLSAILSNSDRLKEMAQNALKLGASSATRDIVSICLDVKLRSGAQV